MTLLEDRAVIEISRADVIQLIGESAKEAVDSTPSDLKPYLVRAVFPVARPTLSISWSGEALHVFAAGLGCAPYTKQPIIVFLDRQPEDVFVMAMSAL